MTNLFGKLKDRSSTFETDQETVLLAALDRVFSKKAPTSDSILEGEILKNVNTQSDTSIRSIPIEKPSPIVTGPDSKPVDLDKQVVIELKPIEVLVKPTDATSGKVTAAELDKAQPTPVEATTVNNTSITNSLPNQSAVTASNSSVNSSNLLINSGKSIMESINSLVNNSKLMESTNKLTAVTNTSQKSKADSSNLSTLESSILSTFNEKSDMTDTKTADVTNNLTQVKNSKLVESSNVKKILAPDKTLEKSVTSLSKSLPEAVNNLSNSVTSISPQTSNSTSMMTEGAKIDQSSRTTINNPNTGNTNMADSADSKPAAISPGINNEYYLQAIYSALMSGKIKVTLGYQ